MRIGRFTVDKSGRVLAGDHDVDTSDVERRLLAEVAARAPSVVPRAVLVAALWPDGLPPGSRALDMAWARLRKRLAPDGDGVLTTVRGVGFALVPDVVFAPMTAAAEIPAAPTRFIGFARELALVLAWVRARAGRWLTVSGMGGVGKTRLAAEAAQALARDGLQPVWVDLAPVADGDAAVLLVAHRLGLDLSRASDPDTALGRSLAGRAALLFLDNLEHIPRASARLGAVLGACPGVRVVATSRRHLRVPGEAVQRVEGLRVRDDAPALYTDLVHHLLVVPDPAALDPELISEVCAVTNGHPLTVELAVATLRRRPPAALLAALRSAPTRLRGERTGRVERHASFEATFTYSWSLLDEGARGALAALSLFAGPFEDDDALAALGVAPRDVAQLVAQSLVGPAAGDRRALHPLIREVARQRLAEHDSTGSVEARYRRWALGWLGASAGGLLTEFDLGLPRAVERRLPDLQAAWQSAVQHHDEAALAAAWPGARAWIELREHATLGLAWCPPAIAVSSDPDLRADMSATFGFCLVLAGRAAEARAALESTLTLAPTAPATHARLLAALGRARAWLGDLDGADAALARAAEVGAPLDDLALHAWLHLSVVARHTATGRNDLSGEAAEAAARYASAAGAGPLLRLALVGRAHWHLAHWRPANAMEHAKEAGSLADAAKDRAGAFAARRIEAGCLRNLGRFDEVLPVLGRLREEAMELGMHVGLPSLLNLEAVALLDAGRFEEAERTLDACVRAGEAYGQPKDVLHALLSLGNLLLMLGRYPDVIAVGLRRRAFAARSGCRTAYTDVLTCLSLACGWWFDGDNAAARRELEQARPLLPGLVSNVAWVFAQISAMVDARDGRRPEAAAWALDALGHGAQLGEWGAYRSWFLLAFVLADAGEAALAASLLPLLREGKPISERWGYLPVLERVLAGVTPEAPAFVDRADADARIRARFEALAAG